MALRPPELSPLQFRLPPPDVFARALGPVDFPLPNVQGHESLRQAKQALGELELLRREILAKSDEYFALDPSDPACAPQALPFPTYPTRRLRARRTQLGQAIKSTLNGRPHDLARPVLVPLPPPAHAAPPWEETLSTEEDLRTRLLDLNKSGSLTGTGISLGLDSHDPVAHRIQLRLHLGSIGWGYLKLGLRRRRPTFTKETAGPALARIGNTDQFSARPGSAPEAERGLEMVIVRANIFASNEKNKGKNEISSFRSFVDLSNHFTSLDLTLPELIHRLPAYLDVTNKPCAGCDRVLKRGIFPCGRAWRASGAPIISVMRSVPNGSGLREESDAAAMDGVLVSPGEGERGDAVSKNEFDDVAVHGVKQRADDTLEMVGEWIAFHLGCWPGMVR